MGLQKRQTFCQEAKKFFTEAVITELGLEDSKILLAEEGEAFSMERCREGEENAGTLQSAMELCL